MMMSESICTFAMEAYMRPLLAILFCFSILNFSSARADEPTPKVKDVPVSISEIYIPGNLDSRSQAFVVASGMFPNGCYRWKGAERTDIDAFTHEVRSLAAVSQGMCIMVLVPFSQEIRLGILKSGTHTLRFLNGDGTYLEKIMVIKDAP